jgi:uncharacterized protein
MHSFMLDLAWPALVVLAGYVLLGLTGFGSALLIVPLLTWEWPLPHVVALTLLLDLPACLLHGGLNLQLVRWDEVRRMWPGMVAGSALGLWLVQILEPRWPLLLLGLYVLTIGLRQMFMPASQARTMPAQASVVAGGFSGMVEMLFGTAGPVMATWLRWRLADVMQLRATVAMLIVCSACIVLAEMALAGQLSEGQLWLRWSALVGVALAGVFIGDRLARRVRVGLLARAVAVLLVLSGLNLLHNFLSA